MKNRFFGYRSETPCPACGTSRIGLDYDDDYFVVPGVLHQAQEPTCSFRGWELRGDRWYASYEAKKWDLRYISSPVEPTTCPACGGKVEKSTECRTVRGTYGRSHSQDVTVWACENAQKKPARLEELSGCPECRGSYSYPGGVPDDYRTKKREVARDARESARRKEEKNVKARITTRHNGDEWEIVTETGERFDRRNTLHCSHNHDQIWSILNRRVIGKRWGGNPYPGVPHWASNFCASGSADIPDTDLAYLRQMKKLKRESADPVTALRETLYPSRSRG